MTDLIPFTHNDEPVTPGEHCLYLVEFIDAGVKVGITIDPARRISQHRRDASAYGREVGRTWVSIPHGNARQNESALKAGAAREYLTREFDDCLAQAATLNFERLDPAAVAAKSEATLDILKSLVLGGAR